MSHSAAYTGERWPDATEIAPIGPPTARIRPPGSKSYTNRALVVAGLALGESRLVGALDSEDTQLMAEGLRRLGIDVRGGETTAEVCVRGCDGELPAREADLFVGNSGTTMRFLTAVVALGRGTYRLDGVPRMRERPIGDLLAAIRQLGVEAQGEDRADYPPALVRSQGLRGGVVKLGGQTSSQFLSGLLMAAPYAKEALTIEIDGPLVSQPYVLMTTSVMADFGVEVNRHEMKRFTVPAGQHYEGRTYSIEPDATAAGYFFAAAAITGGTVTVEGLSAQSLQGDVALVDILEQMGCTVERRSDSITVVGRSLRGVSVDMSAISDTVPTLAAVALFAAGGTTIRGVAHIRHKETDRLAAAATELRRLGANVEEHADGLTIAPGELHGATIETYDDHRMAMSFAIVGLRTAGVVISNPRCVAKTYPRFFSDLAKLSPR